MFTKRLHRSFAAKVALLLAMMLAVLPAISSAQTVAADVIAGTGVIEGIVKNHNGYGIGGVEVSYSKHDGSAPGKTVTDDDGHYRFENLSAGTYSVYATGQINQYLTITQRVENVSVADDQASKVDLHLGTEHGPESGAIAGKVTNEKNVKLGYAEIVVYTKDHDTYWVTRANADGEYSVGALPAGEYAVDFSYEGMPSQHIDGIIVNKGQTTPLDATLISEGNSTTGSVSGSVTDENGKPLADVTISLSGKDEETTWRTTTNEDGMYAISGLPAGSYRMLVNYAANGKIAMVQKNIEIQAGKELTDVNFSIGFTHGKVTGALKGKVTTQPGTEKHVSVIMIGEENELIWVSDLNDKGEYLIGAIPPGTYTLVAELEVPGQPVVSKEVTVTIAAGSTKIQNISLVNGGGDQPPAEQPKKKLSSLKVTPSGSKFSMRPGETKAIRLEARYSDGSREDVTHLADWTSSNDQVAFVENGQIIVEDFGTAVITGRFGEKSVRFTVDAAVKSLTAAKSRIGLKKGTTATIQLQAVLPGGDKVAVAGTEATWESSNPNVVTVENGVVTAVGFGKATVTAFFGGKKAVINVDTSVRSLQSNLKKLSAKPGESKTIILTAVMADGSKAELAGDEIAWESENDEIATVENGVVTVQDYGKTYIVATYGDKKAKIPVEAVIKGIVADPKKLSLKPGAEKKISVKAVLTDGSQEDVSDQVRWTIKNKDVVRYEDGAFVAVGFGRTTITGEYGGKKLTIPVDVSLKKLTAEKTKVQLQVDGEEEVKLTATYGDNSTEQVEADKWQSKNESVAIVENGVIRGVKAGKTSIVAYFGNKKVTISVTVVEETE
jgi:hypothetical protein